MRRLLTIITGQPLVNYIALAEPSTRPNVVHCIFTPNTGAMKERYAALKQVIGTNFSDIEFIDHPVSGSHKSREVWEIGSNLLKQFSDDDWLLNRTVGTEQMRAPLAELFRVSGANRRSFFVETERSNFAFSEDNWEYRMIPFQSGITVEDYFALHLVKLKSGVATNSTEQSLIRAMRSLSFFDIQASCKWMSDEGNIHAEYDCAGTTDYRLYLWERKRLQKSDHKVGLTSEQKGWDTERKKYDIQHDIEKLAYSRAVFGGPFGRVYWVFTGQFPVSDALLKKASELGIRVVKGISDSELASRWKEFGLPQPRL